MADNVDNVTWPGVWATLRALPKPIVVVIVGATLNRAGSLIQIFLMLYLTEDIGISPARAGIVLTMYGIGSIAGVFMGGSVTDRIGPRQTIVTSMLFSGVLIGLLAFVREYLPLLVICVAAGVFAQLFRPAAAALLAERTPSEKLVIVSAAFRFGINVGSTVGPLLGVAIAAYSYRLVFIVDAATSVMFAILALTQLPPLAAASEKGDGRGGGYLQVLRDSRFLLVILAQFATSLAEVQYMAVLPLEIKQRGLQTAVYGALLALNAGMVIVFELPLTRYIQRIPFRTAIALGSAMIGCGVALFGFRIGLWILIVGTGIWTMGEIISAPSINAYPAIAARPGLRGRYIASVTAAQTAGYAVGPAVGAALFQYYGAGMWSMCGILGACAGMGMWSGVLSPGALRKRMDAHTVDART